MGRLINTLAKNFEAVANGTLDEPKYGTCMLGSILTLDDAKSLII